MYKVKQWYINFLEKDKKNFLEVCFYYFLCLLSFIYGAVVFLKNSLYDKEKLRPFASKKKVISLGNISWSGSGKTTLAIYLYEKLSSKFKVAVLRRGYGQDEGRLLEEKGLNIYSSVNRVKLVKKLSSDFDIFILDDGFQYRKLKRDLNIVIMGAREFKKKIRLIPASIFREPFSSLRRAQILVINYKDEVEDLERLKRTIHSQFPHLKIYTAQYKFRRLLDLDNREHDWQSLKGKKIAALAAIGYPQGFFNILKGLGLELAEEIVYPDHYQLSLQEFKELEDKLIKAGIQDLVITHKDKYHLPSLESRLNIYLLEIKLQIDDEMSFLEVIEKMSIKTVG